jgi:hypothetical protein
MRCAAKIERLVPNRFARDTIAALRIRCPRSAHASREGPLSQRLVAADDSRPKRARLAEKASSEPSAVCTWTGELSALEAHRSECVLESVVCPRLRCGAQLLRYELAAHAAVCPQRVIACTHCEVSITASRLAAHVAACPKAPVTCPNAACSLRFVRSQLAAHRTTCPAEPVPCSVVDCCVSVARCTLPQHMADARAAHVSCLSDAHAELTTRCASLEAALEAEKRETAARAAAFELRLRALERRGASGAPAPTPAAAAVPTAPAESHTQLR